MTTNSQRYAALALVAALLFTGTGLRAQNAGLFLEPEDGIYDGFASLGTAAAVSGRTAVVSAPSIAHYDAADPSTYLYEGVVNIYTTDVDRTAWTLTGILHTDDFAAADRFFGNGLALDGKRLIVSSAGAVFIYDKQHQNYVLQDKLSVTPDPSAPLTYKDGVLALRVNDPDAGLEVLVYRVNEHGKARLVSTLRTPDVNNPLALNGGISYDPNEDTFAIGSHDLTGEALGKVYFYAPRGGKWVLDETLPAPSVAATGFGTGVALWKHKLVVGAPAEGAVYDPNANSTLYAGAVYIYRRENGHWIQTQKIATDVPSPASGLVGFGSAIATNGRYVWITAPAPNDHNASTRIAGYSTLFRWDDRQLTLFQSRVAFTSGGGLDMSRRYVIEGDSDPIYGENAEIVDLTFLEGAQSPNAAHSADASE